MMQETVSRTLEPAYCPRCLIRRNSYSSREECFCYSCRDLYNRVYTEVAVEHAALKAQADKYQRYVNDCRPWRVAAERLLPLFALNRLASPTHAFSADASPTYAAVGGASGVPIAGRGSSAPVLWVGNPDLLALCWPLTARALTDGLTYLRQWAMLEPAGLSPQDPTLELWLVRAPYRRPGMVMDLDDTTRMPVRALPEDRFSPAGVEKTPVAV